MPSLASPWSEAYHAVAASLFFESPEVVLAARAGLCPRPCVNFLPSWSGRGQAPHKLPHAQFCGELSFCEQVVNRGCRGDQGDRGGDGGGCQGGRGGGETDERDERALMVVLEGYYEQSTRRLNDLLLAQLGINNTWWT